jgi:DNA-binding NtrC family response regulator
MAEVPVTLIGDTPAMLDLYKVIGRLATNSVPALVVGERGTGKRLVAATIHDNSPRADRPLVTFDCDEASAADVDARLFGPLAGTVELRHVDRLPRPLQGRVALALIAQRTRGSGPRLAARIIATTAHDLADQTRSTSFSRALYDELAVITLRLPPLRERRADIPLLVRYFVQRFNAELNRAIRGIDDRAARMLEDDLWPGNVGELERVIKRASIVSRRDVMGADEIGESLSHHRFAGRPDIDRR